MFVSGPRTLGYSRCMGLSLHRLLGFCLHPLLNLCSVGDLVDLKDGLVVHRVHLFEVVDLRDPCTPGGRLVRSG